ncbi:amino acid ABC transporter substrate-binding protein [Oscillospiraceae bacterium PP1C4]
MKKILSIVLAVMMCATLFVACGAKTEPTESATPSESAASKTPASSEAPASEAPAQTAALPEKLIVGLDASFPPMGFTDQSNNIIGVDIDLAKAVSEKLGIEFEAKPIEWAAKEMELNSGKISCIWNGLTITPERQESMAVSRPYMSNTQVVVVMADSAIKSKADLAGKTVAAQSDSSGLAALQKDGIYASIKGGAAKEYADYVTAMGDLEVGRCDAIVMDSVVANYYITQNAKPMAILEDTMAAEEYGIAAKKGNTALIEAIEGALSELAAEGKIAEISKKWFGKDDMIITY